MKLLFILKYTLKYSKIQCMLQTVLTYSKALTVRGSEFISIKVTDSSICTTNRDIAWTIRQAWSSGMAQVDFQCDACLAAFLANQMET